MFIRRSSDSMVNVTDPEQVDKERWRTVAILQATLKLPIQEENITKASKTSKDWTYTTCIRSENAAYLTACFKTLEQFRDMWDAHLGQINKVTHRVELSLPKARPIYAVPYHAILYVREAEKESI